MEKDASKQHDTTDQKSTETSNQRDQNILWSNEGVEENAGENAVSDGGPVSSDNNEIFEVDMGEEKSKSVSAREKLTAAVKAFLASRKTSVSDTNSEQPSGEAYSAAAVKTSSIKTASEADGSLRRNSNMDAKVLCASSAVASKPHRNNFNIKSVIDRLLQPVSTAKQSMRSSPIKDALKSSPQEGNKSSHLQQQDMTGGATLKAQTLPPDTGNYCRPSTDHPTNTSDSSVSTAITPASPSRPGAVMESNSKKRPVMTLYLKKSLSGQLILTEAVPAGKCSTGLTVKQPFVKILTGGTAIPHALAREMLPQPAQQTKGQHGTYLENTAGSTSNRPCSQSGSCITSTNACTINPHVVSEPLSKKPSAGNNSPKGQEVGLHSLLTDARQQRPGTMATVDTSQLSTHRTQIPSTGHSVVKNEPISMGPPSALPRQMHNTTQIGSSGRLLPSQMEACKIWARQTRHLFTKGNANLSETDVTMKQAYYWIRMSLHDKLPYIEAAQRIQNEYRVSSQQTHVSAPQQRHDLLASHADSAKVPNPTGPMYAKTPINMNSSVVSTPNGLFQLHNVVTSGSHPTRITMRWKPVVTPPMTIPYQMPPMDQPANLISIPDSKSAQRIMRDAPRTFNPTFARMMKCASYVAEHPNRFISDRFLRKTMSDDVYDMDDLLEDAERGENWRFRGPDVIPNWLMNFLFENDIRQQKRALEEKEKDQLSAKDPGKCGSVASNTKPQTRPYKDVPDKVCTESSKTSVGIQHNGRQTASLNRSPSTRLTTQHVSANTAGRNQTVCDIAARTCTRNDESPSNTTEAQMPPSYDSHTDERSHSFDRVATNLSAKVASSKQTDGQYQSVVIRGQHCLTGIDSAMSSDCSPKQANTKQINTSKEDGDHLKSVGETTLVNSIQTDLTDLGDLDQVPEHAMWNLCVRLFPNSRRVRLWRDNNEELESFLKQISQDGSNKAETAVPGESATACDKRNKEVKDDNPGGRVVKENRLSETFPAPVTKNDASPTKSTSCEQIMVDKLSKEALLSSSQLNGEAGMPGKADSKASAKQGEQVDMIDQNSRKTELDEERKFNGPIAGATVDDVESAGERSISSALSKDLCSQEKRPVNQNLQVRSQTLKVDSQDLLVEECKVVECSATGNTNLYTLVQEEDSAETKDRDSSQAQEHRGANSQTHNKYAHPDQPRSHNQMQSQMQVSCLNSNTLRISSPEQQLTVEHTSGLNHVNYEDIPSCSNDFTFGKPISMEKQTDRAVTTIKKKWKLRIACPPRKKKPKSCLAKTTVESHNLSSKRHELDSRVTTANVTCQQEKKTNKEKEVKSAKVSPVDSLAIPDTLLAAHTNHIALADLDYGRLSDELSASRSDKQPLDVDANNSPCESGDLISQDKNPLEQSNFNIISTISQGGPPLTVGSSSNQKERAQDSGDIALSYLLTNEARYNTKRSGDADPETKRRECTSRCRKKCRMQPDLPSAHTPDDKPDLTSAHITPDDKTDRPSAYTPADTPRLPSAHKPDDKPDLPSAHKPDDKPDLPSAHKPDDKPDLPSSHTPDDKPDLPSAYTPDDKPDLPSAHKPEDKTDLPSAHKPDDKPDLPSAHKPDDKPDLPSAHKPDDKPDLCSAHTPDDKPYLPSAHKPEDKPDLPSAHKPDDKPDLLSAHEPDDKPGLPSAYKPDDKPDLSSAHTPDDKPDLPSAHTPDDKPYLLSAHKTEDKPDLPSAHEPDDKPDLPSAHEPDEKPDLPSAHKPDGKPDLPSAHTPDDTPDLPSPHTPDDKPDLLSPHSPHKSDDKPDLPSAQKLDDKPDLPSAHTPDDKPDLSSAHTPDDTHDLSSAHTPDDKPDLPSAHKPDDKPDLPSAHKPNDTPNLSSAHKPDDKPDLPSAHKPDDKPDLSSSHKPDDKRELPSAHKPDDKPDLPSAHKPDDKPGDKAQSDLQTLTAPFDEMNRKIIGYLLGENSEQHGEHLDKEHIPTNNTCDSNAHQYEKSKYEQQDNEIRLPSGALKEPKLQGCDNKEMALTEPKHKQRQSTSLAKQNVEVLTDAVIDKVPSINNDETPASNSNAKDSAQDSENSAFSYLHTNEPKENTKKSRKKNPGSKRRKCSSRCTKKHTMQPGLPSECQPEDKPVEVSTLSEANECNSAAQPLTTPYEEINVQTNDDVPVLGESKPGRHAEDPLDTPDSQVTRIPQQHERNKGPQQDNEHMKLRSRGPKGQALGTNTDKVTEPNHAKRCPNTNLAKQNAMNDAVVDNVSTNRKDETPARRSRPAYRRLSVERRTSFTTRSTTNRRRRHSDKL